MDSVHLEPLIADRIDETADMLARAYLTNPLHVATFGEDGESRNRSFFRRLLRTLRGPTLIAFDGNRIVGAIHWSRSTDCQVRTSEKLLLAPFMLRAFGLAASVRLASWFGLWARHDPANVPHLHLGPVGVDPDSRGIRIGGRLMERFCTEVDRTKTAGYAETDRQGNVDFYRHFGFEVMKEIEVMGVRNWLMWRAPK
ncbi:MAG TPA: GNAT family N-acetyltransferase [Gemmatimonadales bacterium]|nr:GNAT family N-acetyltransferase [Gemmatimonadales bacterium]